MVEPDRDRGPTDRLRNAESVLKRLGYARVPAGSRPTAARPAFWVQEPGVPRRTFPVFVPSDEHRDLSGSIEMWAHGARPDSVRRAIFVVGTDGDAESAWARLREVAGGPFETEVSVLVVPPSGRPEPAPHFHRRVVAPAELLRLATGVVVGLFRRAQTADGTGPVDFEEMLEVLRGRFGIDLYRSLGVASDEDALFVLYQLAVRDAYAPGDPGANLHLLVLKPSGPAARLPWFAA